MPSEKRQRQKERLYASQQANVAAERRAAQRRRVIAGVGALALVAAVVFLVSRAQDDKTRAQDDKTDVATKGNKEAKAGAKIPISADCPKADGSSPKKTTFTKAPGNCIDVSKTYTAQVKTTKGDFTITFDPKRAPKTVNNFVVLARHHFYDGIKFHRIIPGFVVQGGDPKGNGSGGPGYQFADELPKQGDYKIGSLAMANSGPNTNGSQFFVITGPQGVSLPPQYSLFGQVTAGMDVVKAIEKIGSPGEGTPKEEVKMQTVTITEK